MANQIAAGEVIRRPASVVKELVENAVDAGATHIRIVVKDAGKTLIQVIDNGCGMSETDARMAFERHATSKIRKADDLFSLRTMGFRGEALPSICVISEVELTTRTADSPLGTRLVINGSKVVSQEPVACDFGSVFSIRNLFFNVPARRKFLRSDNVELTNIMHEFERLALVNEKVRMSIDTGSKVIDLRAGTLLQRIGELWKNGIDRQLIPVDVDTSLVKIEGFVTRPEYAKRRNPQQFLIVNGRNMRHPYFRQAIISCFENLIAPDTQPSFFLRFTVSPDTIDVNIHPTKNEIKFENEQLIWPILVSAVKTSLGKFSAVPSIDFTTDALPLEPLREGERAEMPGNDDGQRYNPFDEDKGGFSALGAEYSSSVFSTGNRKEGFGGDSYRRHSVPGNWDKLYNEFMNRSLSSSTTGSDPVKGDNLDSTPTPASLIPENEIKQPSQVCLQYDAKYIVTTSPSGLMVIDQHRAHLKILYEKYLRQTSGMTHFAQAVMFPEVIALSASQQAALEGLQKEINSLGFRLTREDETQWSITGVPSYLHNTDPKDAIIAILDSADDEGMLYGRDADMEERVLKKMALAMARSSAIKGGKELSPGEMEHLVGELFMYPDPSLTPDGNPIYCVIDSHRLSGMF